MSDIIFSAFSDEYAVDFNEQLAGMKALDIGYIELRFVDGRSVSELSTDEAKELKKHLDEKEIKVSAIGSPLGKIRLDGDMKGHMEKAARVFEIANIMETKLVRVFSFYAPEGKNIHDCRQMLSYLGWIDCTNTYCMYKLRIKPFVSFGRLKKYIGIYQIRENRRAKELCGTNAKTAV